MPADSEPADGTCLVVVTTDATTTVEIAAWLRRQCPAERVAVRQGFYAGMTAISRKCPVVVVDVGVPAERDAWRLAEVRGLASDCSIVVVADASLLPRLAGPLRPDLAVRTTGDLPPLRELLVSGAARVDDQTMRRRSRR